MNFKLIAGKTKMDDRYVVSRIFPAITANA